MMMMMCLAPFGLPLRILEIGLVIPALAFVLVSYFIYILVTCALDYTSIRADQTQLFSSR